MTDGGQLHLARVADLDGLHGVPGAQRAQRAHPRVRPAEVGDDDDEAGLARDAARLHERVGERVRVVVTVGGDALLQRAVDRRERAAAAARRDRARDRARRT